MDFLQPCNLRRSFLRGLQIANNVEVVSNHRNKLVRNDGADRPLHLTLATLETDYRAMQEMFFEEPRSWSEIVELLQTLEQR